MCCTYVELTIKCVCVWSTETTKLSMCACMYVCVSECVSVCMCAWMFAHVWVCPMHKPQSYVWMCSVHKPQSYMCVSSAQTTELCVYVYVQDANLVLVVRGTLHVLQQSVGISDKEVRAGHATFYLYSYTFPCASLPRLSPLPLFLDFPSTSLPRLPLCLSSSTSPRPLFLGFPAASLPRLSPRPLFLDFPSASLPRLPLGLSS